MNVKPTDYLVIISSLGCVGWTVTFFFGGMILSLLVYWYLIIPLIIVYFLAIISIIRTDNKFRLYWLILLSLPWMVMAGGTIYHSELVQGKVVLSAYLHDDLFSYDLNFRENGNCDMVIVGYLGYIERIPGKYTYNNKMIYFSVKPYDNDFLADSMFVDEQKKAIFNCIAIGNSCSNTEGQGRRFEIDRNILTD